jgi:hypothetical protein
LTQRLTVSGETPARAATPASVSSPAAVGAPSAGPLTQARGRSAFPYQAV